MCNTSACLRWPRSPFGVCVRNCWLLLDEINSQQRVAFWYSANQAGVRSATQQSSHTPPSACKAFCVVCLQIVDAVASGFRFRVFDGCTLWEKGSERVSFPQTFLFKHFINTRRFLNLFRSFASKSTVFHRRLPFPQETWLTCSSQDALSLRPLIIYYPFI